ncbi:MAG: hypothetical protein JSV54_05260 [Chloroflexota bacterium]|nr:MAG: hypothetical protein JSV54_05260 [Chloroflexota bacterium]
MKDIITNIEEKGEYGVNILPIEYLHQLLDNASRYPYGVDELEIASLKAYPLTRIKTPLIREAKTDIECKVIAAYDFATR